MGILGRFRRFTESKRSRAAINDAILAGSKNLLEFTAPHAHCFAPNAARYHARESRSLGLFLSKSISNKPWAISWAYVSTFQDQALNFFCKTRWILTFQFVRGYPLE